VETWRFETANEFLAALERHQSWWFDPVERDCLWMFRGQANSRWPLLPRAWRENAFAPFTRLTTQASVAPPLGSMPHEKYRRHSYLHNTYLEVAAIEHFADQLDQLGFPVPRESVTDEAWTRCYAADVHVHYQVPASSLAALSQHHNIPTRLLDFTRNPFVAAFFAADFVTAGKMQSHPEHLAVWAIHAPKMRLLVDELRVLTAPRSGHSFLHAQDGLFLYVPDSFRWVHQHGAWPSFEVFFDRGPSARHDVALVRQLILPVGQVTHVLDLLWAHRISRAHLMPTIDNVAQSLMRRWR